MGLPGAVPQQNWAKVSSRASSCLPGFPFSAHGQHKELSLLPMLSAMNQLENDKPKGGLTGCRKYFPLFFFCNDGEDNYPPAFVLLFPTTASLGRVSCSSRMKISPLFLFGTLRQNLQVELQHVPTIFVSAEVPLGISKKYPCQHLGDLAHNRQNEREVFRVSLGCQIPSFTSCSVLSLHGINSLGVLGGKYLDFA